MMYPYAFNIIHRKTEQELIDLIGVGFKIGFFFGLPVGSALAVLIQHFLTF